MNKGRTLPSLVHEIERQAEAKKDYTVPSQLMSMEPDGDMTISGVGTLEVNDLAHEHLSAKLQIPKAYYDKMLAERPSLLADNVNSWLHATNEKRFVRTLDERMRCMMSDRYRPLDYYDFAKAALPTLQEHKLQTRSCEITDRTLRLKGIVETMTTKVVGQTVAWGVHMWNSEVGAGALGVALFCERLSCTNGMTLETVFRRAHIGRKHDGDEQDVSQYFSSETRQADDKALWLKFRDTVKGIMSRENVEAVTDRMNKAAGREIADPTQAVAVVVRRFGLNDADREPLFHYLNKDKDFSQWGLANAVTRYAEDQKDYERSSLLESLGGKLIDLGDGEWEVINRERVKL
jgi:hypothetical protein